MISITRCVENGGNGMICVQAKPQTGMPGPVARKKMHLKKHIDFQWKLEELLQIVIMVIPGRLTALKKNTSNTSLL